MSCGEKVETKCFSLVGLGEQRASVRAPAGGDAAALAGRTNAVCIELVVHGVAGVWQAPQCGPRGGLHLPGWQGAKSTQHPHEVIECHLAPPGSAALVLFCGNPTGVASWGALLNV